MYDKKIVQTICEEYFKCSITRKEICNKYNIRIDTLKSWLRRYYPERIKNDPNAREYNAPLINPKYMPLIDNSDYKDMTKEQMQMELIKKDFEIERLKKNYQVKIDLLREKRCSFFQRQEYEIIFILNDKFSVKAICDTMRINRSGYYKWLKRQKDFTICPQKALRATRMNLFKEYGEKYKTHGYRWLNAKNYQNLILNQIAPEEPFNVVVSDMTVMKHRGEYHEVTFYMDLFNNELVAYASSESYNKKLHSCGFINSMSAPGTPTENGAMESINGWVKEELLRDLMIDDGDTFEEALDKYIYYFNYERPAAALNYLTPMQYKQKYFIDKSIK